MILIRKTRIRKTRIRKTLIRKTPTLKTRMPPFLIGAAAAAVDPGTETEDNSPILRRDRAARAVCRQPVRYIRSVYVKL